MRHSIFVNNARIFPNRRKTRSDYPRQKTYNNLSPKGQKQKNTLSLGDQVQELLDLYEDSPEICSEIIGKMGDYRVNITITRDLECPGAENALTKEFKNYIQTMKQKRSK